VSIVSPQTFVFKYAILLSVKHSKSWLFNQVMLKFKRATWRLSPYQIAIHYQHGTVIVLGAIHVRRSKIMAFGEQ
jgi:hypothetical protein